MEEAILVFPQWLDLPEPLAELVLERLPLVDYIRFAAVCPKWRSIQGGHRLRDAPHPPPMAPQLPWLAPLCLSGDLPFKVYSPSDRRSYGPLPIPGTMNTDPYNEYCCLASCRGWLLLLEDEYGDPDGPFYIQPCLFNPITAAGITLPRHIQPRSAFGAFGTIGALSAPPTDPDCILLHVIGSCAALYRPNGDHADWTTIQLPALHGLDVDYSKESATYCGGKFFYSWDDGYKVYVIDPSLQNAAASLLVMRYPEGCSLRFREFSLHEICGELFSVWEGYTSELIQQFRVFKADLLGQEWVSVKTLGDHTLFYSHDCSVFLSAADVGCKRNSIYACRQRPNLLTREAFDLGTENWTEEGTTPIVHGDFEPWFIPALDYANPPKASTGFFIRQQYHLVPL